MRLIRNIFAWIAVAAVIIVMAPIVALINIIVVIGIITGAPAIVMNLAIENVYCLIHS